MPLVILYVEMKAWQAIVECLQSFPLSRKHPDHLMTLQPSWWTLSHHFPSRLKAKYILPSLLHTCSILWELFSPYFSLQQKKKKTFFCVSAETLLMEYFWPCETLKMFHPLQSYGYTFPNLSTWLFILAGQFYPFNKYYLIYTSPLLALGRNNAYCGHLKPSSLRLPTPEITTHNPHGWICHSLRPSA